MEVNTFDQVKSISVYLIDKKYDNNVIILSNTSFKVGWLLQICMINM